MAKLGHELLEALDGAAAADARLDRVAAHAETVVGGLEIDPGIEIEGRAIFVELGTYAASVGKDEIDLFRTG